MSAKKASKNMKLITDELSEFMNQSQFQKDSPKTKKTMKPTAKTEGFEEENIYQASAKKRKADASSDTNPESRKKILDLVSSQLDARKQCNENLFKRLSEITTQLEADYNAMKENEQKLEHLTGNYMKCIQQATIAYKQKLKVLKEVHILFKKECDEMEADHKTETEKVVDEIEYDIKKLQEKLVTETKRSGWESVRRSIFHAMHNDF